MEKIDTYLCDKFKRLVFLYGKIETANSFLQQVYKIKDSDWNNFYFRTVDSLGIPQRKNKLLNAKLSHEGYLKSNWVEKRLRNVPSVVIYLLDWRDDHEYSAVREKEQVTANDYHKQRDILKSRHITTIFVFVMAKNVLSNYDEKIASLRRLLDVDSKQIFLLLNNFDGIQLQLGKRFEKLMLESSKVHYNELLKKHKKRMTKGQDAIASSEFNLRIQLKMAMLYEFLFKSDKSDIQYEAAYQIITQTLFGYFRTQIDYSSQGKPDVFALDNFEPLQKLEELRYLADMIKIRKMYQSVSSDDTINAYVILHKHFNTFKNKIEFNTSKFDFQEYKWKSRIYQALSVLLLDAFDRKPKLFMGDGLPIAICVNGLSEVMKQRERKFNQNNGEILENPDRNINIASDMPYYGFYRYKYKNLDPLDNPQASNPNFIKDILDFRLYQEMKTNLHFFCIEILQKSIQAEKSIKKFNFMLNYTLAQHYFLNNQKEYFYKEMKSLVNTLHTKKWNDLLFQILEQNSKFLKEDGDKFSELDNIIRIGLIKDLSQKQQEYFKSLMKEISQAGSKILKYSVNSPKNFVIQSTLSPKAINYLDNFETQVSFKLPAFLANLVKQVEVKFNHQNYDKIVNIEESKIDDASHRYEIKFNSCASHVVKENKVIIKSILFRGVLEQSGVQFEITVLNENFIQGDDNQVILNLSNDLDIKINPVQKGYVNEMVDIEATIIKESLSSEIKYVVLQLFANDKGIIHEIQPGITPREIQVFYEKDGKNELYSKTTHIGNLNFQEDSQEITVRFSLRPLSETKANFSVKLQYGVLKQSDFNQTLEIPKEISKQFQFQSFAPISYFLNWRTNLREINHQRIKKSVSYKHPLPLNNTSCLNLSFRALYDDLVIKDVKVNMNKDPKFKIFKDLDIPRGIELLKGQIYSSNFIIKPIEEAEEIHIGEIELYFSKKGDQSDKEPIKMNIFLESIAIIQKPFQVYLDVCSSCKLCEMINYNIKIKNTTNSMQKIEVLAHESEAFFFTGPCKYVFDLLPLQSIDLNYKMIAVELGKHKVPICEIKCLTTENEILLGKDEARIIYVYPNQQ